MNAVTVVRAPTVAQHALISPAAANDIFTSRDSRVQKRVVPRGQLFGLVDLHSCLSKLRF